MKLSFGVLVNDIRRLDMVFSKSEIDNSIEAYYIKEPESATKGLNKLIDIIQDNGSDVAILAHQDMFFRSEWVGVVEEKLGELPEDWIVAGVIGKDLFGRIAGKLHDMRVPQFFDTSDIHDFPQQACCFDECVIFVNLKKQFRFREDLDGFDLYGTLCVLQAIEMGGTAWIIDAFCEHYCMRPFSWFPDEKFKSSWKWLYDEYRNIGRLDSTALGVPEGS